MPMRSSEAGSGTAGVGDVAVKVAEYEDVKPPPATAARMPATVPPIAPSMFWVVKIAPEPLSPPGVFKNAKPLRVKSIETEFGVTWVRVNGEPAGVHAAPMAPDRQLAFVPNPGAMLVRLKKIVPAETLKIPKSASDVGPVNGGPERVFRLPPVRPVKVPVFGDSGVKDEPPDPLRKAMLVGVTVTVPEMFAWPVTGEAKDGIAMRPPKTRAGIAARRLIRKIYSPPQECGLRVTFTHHSTVCHRR
jgi:hypothetical protein